MKKILVLGSTGQLGSDLLRINQTATSPLHIVRPGRRELDLSKIARIVPTLAAYDFEALINCASYNKVDQAEGGSDEAYTLNARAVREIALACREKRARLIHVSTDYVFDGNKSSPYLEEDIPAPLNVYGASKLEGEIMARSTHEDTLILRTASLFGIAASIRGGGNFVETVLRMCKENRPLRVVDDITMSPTSAEDLAYMILNILWKNPPPGFYHAVNAGQATWYEFARAIVERARVPADLRPVTSREYVRPARRPRYSVLDPSKVSAVVGSIPPWEEALTRYMRIKGYTQ